MLLQEVIPAIQSRYLANKVTLRRTGAPLLYAYDAHSFIRRLQGMYGLPPLRATDGLLLRPCKAVHTLWLKQSIEVIFMDRHGLILKITELRPGKIACCWRAAVALEVAAGTVDRLSLKIGHVFKPDTGRWL